MDWLPWLAYVGLVCIALGLIAHSWPRLVRALKWSASLLEGQVITGRAERLHSLADRIAALLPPEP